MRLAMTSIMQYHLSQSIIIKLLPWFLIMSTFSHTSFAKEAVEMNPALTVNVVQVQRVSLPLRVTANGNIAAWQEAIIGSEVNGLRLTQVLVNVGDIVTKGQLLAEFSAEELMAEVNQAKGKLMEAEAQGREAIANADRARTLQNTGAMSSQQIDQFTTAADTAKARLEVAQAEVQILQIKLKNTKIYAPDSGVISARTATVGSVIGAGSELFRLISQNKLEWRAEVVSTDIAKIKEGMQVNITMADGSKIIGKVRKTSPTVDILTRNILIYVDLPSNTSAKSGMYAKGEFLLGQSNALALPQQALVLRDGFTYVFEVRPQNGKMIARQIKVQTGRRLLNLVEIVSGLKLQQSVVAMGGGFLADNDVVKVVPVQNQKNK